MLRRIMIVLTAFFIAAGGAARAEEQKASTFSAKTTDGQEFSLDPYLGKVPILLDFGSIYCSTCIKSIPHLVVTQKEYGDKIKVVGVNLDTYGLERVKRFYSAFKSTLNFPILIDNSLKISKAYGVATLPTYVLIDKDGKIVSTIVGFDQDTKQRMELLVKKVVEGVPLTADEQIVKQNVLLLSPDNFTKTFDEDIGVVGTTGGNPGPITIRLNGGSERQAVIKGGMYYARTPLALGSNFIEVRYPKEGGFGTLAVVMFRDPRMGEGLGGSFPQYQFHTPEKEARCTECHNMKAETEKPEAGTGGTGFCATCHGDQIKVKFVHGPITVGGCAACHDFESKPHKYDVGAEGTDLCFTCHGDVQDKFEHANVHGPVAMGLCVACHSPHGSNFKFQLRHQQTTLCLGCHEDMREKVGKFRPHKPIQDESCTGCHDPHSSDVPKNFLRAEGVALCLRCHSEAKLSTHTHQKDGTPPRVVEGMRLLPDGTMNCLTCHDPHSSDEVRLFTVKGGCNGCHAAQ